MFLVRDSRDRVSATPVRRKETEYDGREPEVALCGLLVGGNRS
jgi:hypothetical protein